MAADSVLTQKLSELIGDWLEVDTTTDITTDTLIKSTSLNEYDYTRDDYFNNWWAYITEGENIAVERRVEDYTASGGVLDVYGASLEDETGAKTFRLGRYSYSAKRKALNTARLETYPALFRPIEDTLVTGNILPTFNWLTSATLEFYTKKTGTLLKNTDAAFIWRGLSSAKLTASGDDDYIYIDSTDYPELLDLMGKTINFKCQVYPEVANDAFLTIAWTESDGTTDTANSTTTCPAAIHTLLEMEQAIPDNIKQIQLRLRVHSDTEYVYFDPPRVEGRSIREFFLPKDFRDGHISRVEVQTSGDSDDIRPQYWDRVYGATVIDRVVNTTSYKFLQLPYLYSSNRQIRLIGDAPLEELASFSGTMTIDGERVNLLIAYAAYVLYRTEKGVPSSEDKGRFDNEAYTWLMEYRRMKVYLGMSRPSQTMHIHTY